MNKILEILNLETGYGKKQVLFNLNLDVSPGEIVAIIGPNGSGKSTILKTVCGLIQPWRGEIRFDNDVTNGTNPAQNVFRGITFAPQGNLVFKGMTVMENLEIGGYPLKRKEAKERINEVLEIFPAIKERLKQDAGELSGGEQQMLALSRALIPKPKLLMLDEPSLGLSPKLMGVIFDKIIEINRNKEVTILIVEQKVREILEICERVYSIKLGKNVFEGVPSELKENKEKMKELFL